MIKKEILIIIMRTCEQRINNEVDPVGGISTTTAFVEAAFVNLVNISFILISIMLRIVLKMVEVVKWRWNNDLGKESNQAWRNHKNQGNPSP